MRRHVAELPRHFVGDNGPGLADCRGHMLDLGRLFDQDREHRRFLNIFHDGHQTLPATPRPVSQRSSLGSSMPPDCLRLSL